MASEATRPENELTTYLVVWSAPDHGQVDHLVLAPDADEACRISAGELRKAVGKEFASWRLRAAS